MPWRRAGLLALGLLMVSGAHAHGDWPPRHGGLMNEGGETSFELVRRGRDVILYVEDHGTPVPTQGAKGVLTVSRGERAWSAEIKATGDNRMASRLAQPLLGRGAAVASIDGPGVRPAAAASARQAPGRGSAP